MVFENLVEALPEWITLTLFLSYIIWSKYLNKGKLAPDENVYPQKIDAFIIVFAIFIIFLAFIWSTSITLYFFSNVLNEVIWINEFLEFSFSGNQVGISIIILNIILILALSSTIKQNKKKEDLISKLTLGFLTIFCFISFLLGLIIYSSLKATQYLLKYVLLMILIFMPVFIIFYLITIPKASYFYELSRLTFLRKKIPAIFVLLIVSTSLILGITISIFVTPSFSHADNTQRYIINEDFRSYGYAKKEIKRNFVLERPGYLLKLVSLDLKGMDLKNDNKLYFNYIGINRTGGQELRSEYIALPDQDKKDYSQFGILDYQYYANSNLLFKIKKDTFIEKEIHDIYVKGITHEDFDISKEFIINYSKLNCEKDNCSQNISFINNLDYPIETTEESRRITLLNDILFEKRCDLIDAREIEPEKPYVIFDSRPESDSFMYFITKHRITGDREMHLAINGHMLRLLDAYHFFIQNNTRIDLTFYYTCK